MSRQDDRRAAVNSLRRGVSGALAGRANAFGAVRLYELQMVLDHIDELEAREREASNSGDRHG